ncbi:MAG: RecX family transcriptional regulator, partial [Candidatus Cloacimonetes bacterium]|nr:RecX family transcriptional regulator [Candidatus Cloacimonadota bacterium]
MKIKKRNKSTTVYYVDVDDITWGILPSRLLQVFVPVDEDEAELTFEQAAVLEKEITSYCHRKLLDFLAVRERSVQECRNFLKKLSLRNDLAAGLILRAQQENHIDDKRFAELNTISMLSRNKSPQEIRNKLRGHGIPENTILTALEDYYSQTDLQDIIRIEILKMLSRYEGFDTSKKREKIFSHLYRKGFDYETVKL